jgi:aspartyl aminopeptidase
MGCGSTIGPLTAANLGVTTLDIGVPQFAMHSIRETAGAKDGLTLYQVLREFMQRKVLF